METDLYKVNVNVTRAAAGSGSGAATDVVVTDGKDDVRKTSVEKGFNGGSSQVGDGNSGRSGPIGVVLAGEVVEDKDDSQSDVGYDNKTGFSF